MIRSVGERELVEGGGNARRGSKRAQGERRGGVRERRD